MCNFEKWDSFYTQMNCFCTTRFFARRLNTQWAMNDMSSPLLTVCHGFRHISVWVLDFFFFFCNFKVCVGNEKTWPITVLFDAFVTCFTYSSYFVIMFEKYLKSFLYNITSEASNILFLHPKLTLYKLYIWV